MDNTISGDNSTAGSVDNQATGPTDGGGTAQPTGQVAGQPAPGEEIFKGVDPNQLPPQLRAHYDSMLRDYRSKTEKLSETAKQLAAKEIEPYSKKAQAYDQLLQQEEFVRRWNEFVEESNTKQSQQNVDPNDPNAKLLKEVQELKKSQKEIADQVRTAEALETINAFKEAVNDKGEKLHPNFDRLSEFKIGSHDKAGEYDLLRAAVELAPGGTPVEKLENGYKAAQALYDTIYEEGKKAGMGRLQDKARASTLPPSSVGPTTAAPGRPKDALEALQWARKGLAVQR